MSAITVLNKDNVPTGPFTRAQVTEKLQTGEMTLENLAFVKGLSQWTPLREVLAKVDAASIPPVPPPIIPGMAASSAAPAYSYAATMQPPGHLVYAGFWLRVVAYILDSLILGIPMGIAGAIIGGIYGFAFAMNHPRSRAGFLDADGNLNVSFVILELGIMTLSITAKWLYYALQESSTAQATLGKRILGLKVTNLAGQRLGFGQATGRFFGKILSAFILMIGFIMAGFTERKQALHDILAGTLVVRK